MSNYVFFTKDDANGVDHIRIDVTPQQAREIIRYLQRHLDDDKNKTLLSICINLNGNLVDEYQERVKLESFHWSGK